MIKKLLFIAFLSLLTLQGFGQQKVTWDWFSRHIRFEEKFFEDEGILMLGPVFDKEILALEGQEIIVTGYIMLIDKEFNYYALSANSFARCFFCGGAGPETVMSLNFINTSLTFQMDDFRTVKGKLRLNVDNFDETFLILDDVQLYDDL